MILCLCVVVCVEWEKWAPRPKCTEIKVAQYFSLSYRYCSSSIASIIIETGNKRIEQFSHQPYSSINCNRYAFNFSAISRQTLSISLSIIVLKYRIRNRKYGSHCIRRSLHQINTLSKQNGTELKGE